MCWNASDNSNPNTGFFKIVLIYPNVAVYVAQIGIVKIFRKITNCSYGWIYIWNCGGRRYTSYCICYIISYKRLEVYLQLHFHRKWDHCFVADVDIYHDIVSGILNKCPFSIYSILLLPVTIPTKLHSLISRFRENYSTYLICTGIVFFLFCWDWLFCYHVWKKKKKQKDNNLPDYTFIKHVVRSVVFYLIVNALRFLYERVSQSSCHTAQWLSGKSLRLGSKGF